MTCRHGRDPMPPVRPFENDAELMRFLGLPNTEKGRAVAEAMTAEQRRPYAEMRAVEEEIRAGRIPMGVIACDRVGKAVR